MEERLICRMLTPLELANQLRVKVCTVRHWVKQGKIPVIRISRKVLRFRLEDVLAVLEEV
jgi:excisionase family DNA binding protein